MGLDSRPSAAVGLLVTLTASWRKIFRGSEAGLLDSALLLPRRASAGKTSFGSAKDVGQVHDVVRNTFIQGTLSIIFAVVVIIVVAAAVVMARCDPSAAAADHWPWRPRCRHDCSGRLTCSPPVGEGGAEAVGGIGKTDGRHIRGTSAR